MNANEAHWQRLIDLTSAGGPLAQSNSKASLEVAQWFKKGRPQEERRSTRRQIAALIDTTNGATSTPPTAILLAGPPGSGKSSALNNAATAVFSGGPMQIIDADQIKDELIVASLRDGTLHTLLMPPAISTLARTGIEFHPRELSTLVHSESAFFAEALVNGAVKSQQSFVLDATMQNGRRAVERVTELKKAGYHVSIVEVSCTLNEALQRTYDRWLAGRELAQQAAGNPIAPWNDSLGGRFVPPAFVRSLFTGPGADASLPHLAAQRAFAESGADRLIRYRVEPGRPAPVLDSIATRREDGKIVRLTGVQATASAGDHDLSPTGVRRGTGKANPLGSPPRPAKRRPKGPNATGFGM